MILEDFSEGRTARVWPANKRASACAATTNPLVPGFQPCLVPPRPSRHPALESAELVCTEECHDSRPGWSTSAVENGAASVQIHAQCLLFLEICPLPVTEDGTFRILSLDQLVRFRVEGRQNGVGVEAAVQQTVQSRQFQPSTDNSRKGVDCKLFLHSLTMNELVNFYQF